MLPPPRTLAHPAGLAGVPLRVLVTELPCWIYMTERGVVCWRFSEGRKTGVSHTHTNLRPTATRDTTLSCR